MEFRCLCRKQNYHELCRSQGSDIKFGQVIDNFIESDNEFYMLDYIMSALSNDDNYDAYHLFKNFSLIEMVIEKNSKDLIKFNEVLSQYLISEKFQSENQKNKFLNLIRQIRNKIAHGDFRSVKHKLEEYADEFMKSYHFDYYEYSRENWIYMSICCELDEILSRILWSLLFRTKESLLLERSN